MKGGAFGWLLAAAMTTVAATETTVDPYVQSVQEWRSARLARLQKPDGWLSLVGLHWLDEGRFSLGRDPGNDIVLNTGPAKLGEIERRGEVVTLHPTLNAGVSLANAPISEPVVLQPDSSGAPSVVSFPGTGEASFMLIERSGRFGLRVRDSAAPTRSGFVGIESYPIDPRWRVEARFVAHPPGRTIEIASVINTLEPMPNPGVLEFEMDGALRRLEVVDEGDGALFVIFADRTNGKDTYGPGRFLYAEAAGEGRAIVDFNRAYNPPCAFNAYSTCPLPPPENRLDLRVEAGEKRYQGPHG